MPVLLEDKDVDDLTLEEMRELLRRQKVGCTTAPPRYECLTDRTMQALREQAPGLANVKQDLKQELKRERIGDAADADRDGIETGQRPKKRVQGIPAVEVEVIDLCDDE